ncbi:pyruvate kinase [Bradyrhizobium sp. URHC0002]
MSSLSARMTAGLMPMLALAATCLWSSPAAADFRLCNNTSSRVGIALGYKDAEGWTTEGWWNVSSRSCETLLRGTLVARYYYIYALDYDRGGEWSGQAFMCSRDKEFTIKGTENCLGARLRPHRVLRGRHRRTASMDRATDRSQRAARAARAGNSGNGGTGQPRRGSRPVQSTKRSGSAASRGAQAMRRLRRIKILATLGPASSDSAMIRKLFEAGADVFRINMSHTPHDKMRELVSTIRNVESSYGRPIGILVDLQGPKLRLGAFAEGSTQLKNGQSFVLDSDKTPGDNNRVQLPHPEILAALRPGHALLLDDGKVRLIAEETSPDRAVTRVVIGGKMSDRKGVSLPDTDLPVSAMTPKDRADLEAALVTGVDWIALSFVQRAEDVHEAKRMIRGRAAVMAKIEKPQAIDRLGEIIDASDALMVARGDLGVELPLERVPSLQKQMTRMARRAGKPVVIATQMLESMIQSPVPTRAEVSDVATAVYEGADAIMLSAESAAGKFPVEAVSTMNRIGEEVERDPTYRSVLMAQRPEPENTVGDAIADAARQIAETLELSAIICWTSSGSTAIRVARERPKPPVVAITPNLATGRKLSVVWGVHCVVAEDAHDQDDMVDRAGSIAFRDGFANAGQRVIIVAGVPLGIAGTTNMVRIANVEPEGGAKK